MYFEQASFTPLDFATTGDMGREATVWCKQLAHLISTQNSAAYITPPMQSTRPCKGVLIAVPFLLESSSFGTMILPVLHLM